MLIYTKVREERSNWGDVYGEEKRPKYRPLRHPRFASSMF
jgi:hypothetical protein